MLHFSGSRRRELGIHTNTHCLTTLSLTFFPPVSPSEARTWAWPSLVCPIVCFMWKGKSDVIVRNKDETTQEVHLVQTVTTQTSTEHREAQNVWLQMRMIRTQLTTGMLLHRPNVTRHSFQTTTEDNTNTQQLPWRVWIIDYEFEAASSAKFRKPTTEKNNSSRNLKWPFRQAISYYSFSKRWGEVTCYCKIPRVLSLPWIPGLFTLPHAVFWTRASQCSRISGMTLRQAAGPMSSSTAGGGGDGGGDWHTDQRQDGFTRVGVGGDCCVHLQSISERVLSARACLLVERMVCLTAERGWNKRGDKEEGFNGRSNSRQDGCKVVWNN